MLLISHAECYATSGSLHLGLSDYDLNFTMRKNKAKAAPDRAYENREFWLFKLLALADLKRVPWSSAYTYDKFNAVWAYWRPIFKVVLDQHVPLKKEWIRGDKWPRIGETALTTRKLSRRSLQTWAKLLTRLTTALVKVKAHSFSCMPWKLCPLTCWAANSVSVSVSV